MTDTPRRQGFAALTPAQRQLAAAHGSLIHWSRKPSADQRRAALAPARAGMQRRWEAEAQANGPLRAAHYKRMSLASSRARAAR